MRLLNDGISSWSKNIGEFEIRFELENVLIYMDDWVVLSSPRYDHFKSTDELSNVIFLTPDSESTLPDAEQLYSKRDDYIFIIGGIGKRITLLVNFT